MMLHFQDMPSQSNKSLFISSWNLKRLYSLWKYFLYLFFPPYHEQYLNAWITPVFQKSRSEHKRVLEFMWSPTNSTKPFPSKIKPSSPSEEAVLKSLELLDLGVVWKELDDSSRLRRYEGINSNTITRENCFGFPALCDWQMMNLFWGKK